MRSVFRSSTYNDTWNGGIPQPFLKIGQNIFCFVFPFSPSYQTECGVSLERNESYPKWPEKTKTILLWPPIQLVQAELLNVLKPPIKIRITGMDETVLLI